MGPAPQRQGRGASLRGGPMGIRQQKRETGNWGSSQVYKYLCRVGEIWYDSCRGEDEKTESIGSDLNAANFSITWERGGQSDER